MVSLVVVLALLPTILAHSWMTCPPSINPATGRGGIQGAQCEGWGSTPVTEVEAGDRLKVGWVSNNHGGGYARISLVQWGQKGNAQAYKDNVMKFACYGHDERPGKYQYGDCKHPCNGRPGCEYQAKTGDVERYDTTIGIPTNLPEGDYSLQVSLLVGNAVQPYNSCGKLRIKGGNPSFRCKSSKVPVTNTCLRAGGPARSRVSDGTKRGDFCYGLDGSIGTVDDNMSDVPVNVECDPRVTCGQSVDRGLCEREFPNMARILTPRSNPRQPNCRPYNVLPVM
ncbi:uncharacterized protein [Clytia hemisphaerica]|uniref:Uncharacterized protein n=1 Tax=Clytia hemisphaerica TaxID=252671 RepID=A0A7M5WJJ3_9CNID|eukprot:TCONS_00059849-protein